jgi:protein-disulfide isomerase
MNKQPNNNFSVAILLGSLVIALAILVSTFIQVFGVRDKNTTKVEKTSENITYVRVDHSPTLGDKNAPITVVEYTDFDCPICKQVFDSILPKLSKEYISTKKIKFVFKSLPIENFHPYSVQKAEAAYCARDQKGERAFFDYYVSLFQKFGTILPINQIDELTHIAEQNGLNTVEFKLCLENKKFYDSVKKESVEATVIGSMGTPTWLIGKSTDKGLTDTVKINGLVDYAIYKTVIDHLLEQ